MRDEKHPARWSRAGSYNHGNYLALNSAVLGVWRANELNIMDHDGTHDEWRLAFVMDYGFESEQDFVNLIGFECAQLASQGTTHLCFMCESRAGEYPALARLADDEQRFAVHTLPWIAPDLAASTIYCDSFYC